jgi:unsaturated chondroitin disaccharide hydrolase
MTLNAADRRVFETALEFSAAQARRLIRDHAHDSPMYTIGGKWDAAGERWTHWCDGFYPGIMWLLHAHYGDADFRLAAEELSRRLEPRRFDRDVHDLGFLFFSTYLRWYHRDGGEHARRILIDAGRTLALRRQMGGYLASFIGPHSLFIDIMMNVGITLWAARETGSRALREIALEHCRCTQQYLVREDGGTAHEGIFDVQTGEFLRQSTHQGWAAESTWSRGLAWAIYGFTAVFRLSGEAEFLTTARRCSGCWLRRIPSDMIPCWDFDVPAGGPQMPDSSAAAIAASGLFDLSEAVNDPDEAARYRNAAVATLRTLCTDQFLAKASPAWEGILLHGVYHLHKNLGVDESVAWGDHFFVEALVKALAGRPEAAW